MDGIVELGLRTVREVRSATSAGTGCTCCHHQIRELLEAHVVVKDYTVV